MRLAHGLTVLTGIFIAACSSSSIQVVDSGLAAVDTGPPDAFDNGTSQCGPGGNCPAGFACRASDNFCVEIGFSDASPAADAPNADANITTGTYYHYVTDSLKIGHTPTEAESYAFNLDNDVRNIPDNAIGHVLAGLSSQVDFDAEIAASLDSGAVVMLHSLRADSLTEDQGAPWQVYLGTPFVAPNRPDLGGGGIFTIDTTGPMDAQLIGAIEGAQFLGGPETITVRLPLIAGQPPIEVRLLGARVQTTCTADACTSGKLGGGISATDMNDKVVPALAQGFQARIDADGHCSTMCQTTGACSSKNRNTLDVFDTNNDCHVTTQEMMANPVIQVILMPDVDLVLADGITYGQDGVKESVSLGLGFTTTRAIFAVPGESDRSVK